MRMVPKAQSRSSYGTYRDGHRLNQRGRDKINIRWQLVDVAAGYDGTRGNTSRMIDAEQGEVAANIGMACQAGLTAPAVHRRIDKYAMTHRQIPVRLGQAADEFMPEDDSGLSTVVFAVCDVQVAAANPGVRDVDAYPAGAGLGHGDRPDGDDSAAFPDQRVLLSHAVLKRASTGSAPMVGPELDPT
jgi:hypothetical protein